MKQIDGLTAVVIVLLTFTLTACATPSSADEILNRVQQSFTTEPRVHLVQEWSRPLADGQTHTAIVERWRDGAGRSRLEARSVEGELLGVVVTNGEDYQFYDAESNVYSDMGFYVSEYEVSEEAYSALIRRMQENVDFTIDDATRLAGRRVFHLQGMPATDEDSFAGVARVELWIDAERYSLLGLKVTDDDGAVIQEVTQTVDYDPALPDELFEFTLPEGAERR